MESFKIFWKKTRIRKQQKILFPGTTHSMMFGKVAFKTIVILKTNPVWFQKNPAVIFKQWTVGQQNWTQCLSPNKKNVIDHIQMWNNPTLMEKIEDRRPKRVVRKNTQNPSNFFFMGKVQRKVQRKEFFFQAFVNAIKCKFLMSLPGKNKLI